VLTALSVGGEKTLFVALLYLGVQTFEANVLAPLIQRHTIDLLPALTIISQTVSEVTSGCLFAAVQQLHANRAGSPGPLGSRLKPAMLATIQSATLALTYSVTRSID
jgi:hypothetical protein